MKKEKFTAIPFKIELDARLLLFSYIFIYSKIQRKKENWAKHGREQSTCLLYLFIFFNEPELKKMGVGPTGQIKVYTPQ